MKVGNITPPWYLLFVALLATVTISCSGAEPQEPEPAAAASQPSPAAAPSPSSSQAPPAASQPTTPPSANPTAGSTAIPTATEPAGVVQTPRIDATPTHTPTPVPTMRPTLTPTSTVTVTPTPEITGLELQAQMSEEGFRRLKQAFDSGQITQGTGCQPVPSIDDMHADVLEFAERGDTIDGNSLDLSKYVTPYILVLDVALAKENGFFDSTFEIARQEGLPGISSAGSRVALINRCTNTKIPDSIQFKSRNADWILYLVSSF